MQQNPPPPEQPAELEGPQQSQASFSAPPISPPLPADSRSMHRVALKYGLMFGLIIVTRLALGSAITTPLSYALPELVTVYRLKLSELTQISNFITAFFTLIDWIIYFLAGFFAARRVPQVRTAILTSLWVNLCYSLVYCGLGGINLFLFTLSSLSQHREAVIGAYVGAILTQDSVILILLHIVLGTAVAALGGLVGARSVK